MAMLDMDRNPTAQDAPFPHYWLYHGMWPFPALFLTLGFLGLPYIWPKVDHWKFWILTGYVLCVTYAFTIIMLDAFFVTHYNSFNGIDALTFLTLPSVILMMLLTFPKLGSCAPEDSARNFQ